MIDQVANINLTKNIRFKSSMLRSDLCDYSNAYIVAKKEQVLLVLMVLTEEIKS